MGEGLYICGFGEGGVHTDKQTFSQKVVAGLVTDIGVSILSIFKDKSLA